SSSRCPASAAAGTRVAFSTAMSPRGVVALFIVSVAFVHTARPSAEPVPARLVEGTSHGFLVLRSVDGTLLANGDQAQVMRGGILTNHLVFRFKDGSVDDSTTV